MSRKAKFVPSWKPRPVRKRPRSWFAAVVITVYLSAIGWFLFRHVLGDSVSRPVAYFFTWDMFPYYSTQNVQRIAIGETVSGRFVQVYPSPAEQYRLGLDDQFSRIDLLPRPETEPVRGMVYGPLQRTLDSYQKSNPDDEVVNVFLAEKVWPHRMNYRDSFFEDISGPKAKREFGWKVLEAHTLNKEGKILPDE